MLEFLTTTIVPYLFLSMFITFVIVSALVWTPIGNEWAKMDIRKQYKMRYFRQTYGIAIISPFVFFFLHRQGFNVPFFDFQLIKWLEEINYFGKSSTSLDRSIFDIFDSIFLWVWRLLQYYMPPFFIIALYRSRESVIESDLAGEITRGVQFFKDNKKFIKAIIKASKEAAKRLEKDLKIKLPSFYTARIFLGKHLIPIFKDLETKSIIFLGGAGSGKSVAIWEYVIPLIKWSRDNHQFTWIVYDMKHDFYTKMYRKDKDVLFFPKHKDTCIWNMFREFHNISYDENGNKIWEIEIGEIIQFVSYWMPTKEGDSSSVWIEKAQKAAVAVLITVSKEYQNPSMKDFIDFTMMYNTKDKIVEKILELGHANMYGYNISAIFGETEAGSNVYEIFEQATTEIRKLDFYFSDEEANFSVKEFNLPISKLTKKDIKTLTPKERNMDRRLFLVQDQNNTEYYSTAFRIILELQAKKLIAFEQDLERRVFFLLDEAASLGKMTCVFDEIPEKGRSKGGALIIGLQTLAKFKGIYTEDIMNSILANIKTKVFMSIEDPYTQKWIKESLDSTESERNSLSANEKDGGSVSYSLESRDTLKSTEISGLMPNVGYLRMFTYLTKIEFRIQKIKDNIQFEPNKNIPQFFRTEFGQEEEVNINFRREETINAMLELKTKTTKPINAQNVNLIVKKNLDSVSKTLNLIKEEQEQILTTIKEMLKLEGFSYEELNLKDISKRTGLETHIIELNYSLIKATEIKYIERVAKIIEKVETSGLDFKSENEKIKKLIEISGENEANMREAYQKIKSNKFYPDELPYEVKREEKRVELLQGNEEDKKLEDNFVPEVLNGPDEDIPGATPISITKEERILKADAEVEAKRKQRELERERLRKERELERERTRKERKVIKNPVIEENVRIDFLQGIINTEIKEEVNEEIDMKYLDSSYEEMDIQMPDEDIQQDSPFNHPNMN